MLARIARAAIFLALLGVVALSISWWLSRPAIPDAFYEASSLRPAEPGALLRSEPFAKAIPVGTRAWRILYTTTRADNSPAAASAIVVAPEKAAYGPRPVIAWAHGTTGIAPGCAPSVMANPFANVPGVDRLVGENWIYVATDYVGLGTASGHAYLIGEDAARAVLDAVRASRRLPDLDVDNRIVVWGHSQGGNSALWTGMRVAAYAPDVNVLGIAALAPASDLRSLIASGQSSMFGKIVSSYLVHAYGAAYRDIDAGSYVRMRARPLVNDIAARCVGEWGTLLSVLETALLPGDGIFAQDPTDGALGYRLLQNSPYGPIAAPVMIAQGQADDLVLPDVQARFVASRCAAGQPIDYRIYPGRDHVSVVAADSPLIADLVDWTRDRFAGQPASTNCGR
jgi:alpha-beta hydrolase superfamily lysophospholipase